MAPSITVKQVRTAERDRLIAELGQLQTALATATSQLAAAQADADQVGVELGALEQGVADLRTQIADPATTPGQLHQLEQDLLVRLLAQTKKTHQLAGAQDAVARGDRSRARAAAAVDRTRANLVQAEAALAQATQADAQTSAWRAALESPELDAMVAEAASQATGDLVDDVEADLKVFVGQASLYDLLALRLRDAQDEAEERDRAARRALDALDALRIAQEPLDGAVWATAAAFEMARQVARYAAELAGQEIAAARSTLQRADAEAAPTPGEQTLVNARAAAVVANPNAVPIETALHLARIDERSKLAALEALALPALAADPDFDVPGDPLTDQAASDHDDAVQETAAKENALTPAMRTKIDAWEVAVPPRIMAVVTDALRATATVERVKALDLDQTLTDLDDAEEAHAEALRDQAEARALLEAAGDRAAARADDADAVRSVADQRVAAGVRGDQ